MLTVTIRDDVHEVTDTLAGVSGARGRIEAPLSELRFASDGDLIAVFIL